MHTLSLHDALPISIFFFILLPTSATFLLFFLAALIIFFILAIFEEKHVTTILLENLENTFINSSLTSFSDCDIPGTFAFVESPTRASKPSLPNFSNCFFENDSPKVGE